ncbi:MAG: polysaccharide deacetylase family protein [Planctomycetota bacterium]|nr:polysaccharide deacetylase family protein [Planctomycetota bacterium]
MNIPSQLRKYLVAGYCGLTLPWRYLRNARAAAVGQSPVMIFFYHRIADDQCVPWNHTNAEFQRQVCWLREHCDLVSLSEAQARIASGYVTRPTAAITFDDGYAENCEQAIPWLIAQQIPCTYYVSTDFVRQQRPFPQDAALGLDLPPNTVQQIRDMSDAGIEIGGHTRSHCDLGKVHDPATVYDEVIGGAHDLEDMTGRAVRTFAFPYGLPKNMSPAVFDLCQQEGYSSVASAYGDYNLPGEDSFHLRRIHADDMIRLRNWGTVDPRKLRYRMQYDYRATIPLNDMVTV